MRRTPQNQSQLHIEQSDDECNTSSPSQILERVQSDRVTVTKPEEDRRRRTIIVEKKNGSYGFTLQSYGIHYKKEKEIEMITYVDYVDYDGPAYRAGMREGDVILSINGTDMEKADHKTLVNYIKQCDARMRMVVLFEDCVRKVELHMKYIQLQRILQTKMEELDRLCIRERQLLEGKWKTHSLPARKKASHSSTNGGGEPSTPTQTAYSYCRPTVSTEDVAKVAAQQQKQSQPLVFAYQYLDSHYRYMLHPSTSSSGEYLLTFEPPRYNKELQQQSSTASFIAKTPCEQITSQQKQTRGNQTSATTNIGAEKPPKKSTLTYQSYAGQLCNPCGMVQSSSNNNNNHHNSNNNGDNTSLDAYDLASPCCDPRCIPSGGGGSSSRRRARSHKDSQPQHNSRKRDSKTEETQTDPQQSNTSTTRSRPPSSSSHSQAAAVQAASSNIQAYSVPRRYFHIGAGIVSQCSLHSCTSSEISSNVVPTTTTMGGESSANSYTTSLSTDTLYWDGASCDNNSRQLSLKSNSKQDTQHQQQHRYSQQPSLSQSSHQHQQEAIYVQYNNQVQVKPKSWDNLATKAFGGYGFGYGYLDTSSASKVSQKGSSSSSRPSTKSQGTQYVRLDKVVMGNSCSSSSGGQPQYTPHSHRRYFQPTKSTESLLSVPKYSNEALSDTSSISCECLDIASSAVSPGADTADIRFFQNPRHSRLLLMSPTTADHPPPYPSTSSGALGGGYYSVVRRPTSQSEYKNVVTTSSEATRL